MIDPLWLEKPQNTLVALDFDGTLSPIVIDPERAWIHEESAAALRRLSQVLGQVAIVTGRPVAQVRRLARFERDGIPRGLAVCGQYGAEWWDSVTGEQRMPEPPADVAALIERLPAILAKWGAEGVRVEDKRLAVALHTRGLDPAIWDRIERPLNDLADQHGLQVEPGRQVIELRTPGTDKGAAVRMLAERLGADRVIYAGDDLGDLPAFAELARLRSRGVSTLGIAVVSTEQTAVAEAADLVVDGTDGIAAWLSTYAEALGA